MGLVLQDCANINKSILGVDCGLGGTFTLLSSTILFSIYFARISLFWSISFFNNSAILNVKQVILLFVKLTFNYLSDT